MKISELRKLAEAATPGPWKVDQNGEAWPWLEGGDNIAAESLAVCSPSDHHFPMIPRGTLAPQDAAHIAACSPERILCLLAVIEAANNVMESSAVYLHGKDYAHTCDTCAAIVAYEDALAALEQE